MYHNKKALLFVLVISLIGLTAKKTMAQFPGMGAVRAQQNTMFMNQQMQMQMMGIRGGTNELTLYSFSITMVDGTKKEIVSAIYTDIFINKNYLQFIDKRYKKSDTNRYKKIYPSQTSYIAKTIIKPGIAGDENAPVRYLFGRPVDSCWMFNVRIGTISLFSNVCNDWDDDYSPATIVGMQLNDGPILKYNPENIKEIINQDLEAMKYFDEKKYVKSVDKYNSNIEKDKKK